MKRKITAKLYEWKNMKKAECRYLFMVQDKLEKRLKCVNLEHYIIKIQSM